MADDDYKFTKDWFSWAPQVWEQLIPILSGTAGERSFLEVGSFEGRSGVWIMENMMQEGDWLTCIDTWEGGEEHSQEDMAAVWERFRENMDRAVMRNPGASYRWLKQTSTDALAHLIEGDASLFEFIYIDGSHIAKDVLTDACMAWSLLAPNGIVVFDDYLWGNPRDVLHRPKAAIDAFTTLFAEELEIIHVGYQAVVRKKGQ